MLEPVLAEIILGWGPATGDRCSFPNSWDGKKRLADGKGVAQSHQSEGLLVFLGAILDATDPFLAGC